MSDDDFYFIDPDELYQAIQEEDQAQDVEEQAEPLPTPNNTQNQGNNFAADIYKKWFKTKQKSGFLALRGWLEAGKVSVDIGEVADGTTNNTLVWCDAVEFATYIKSVVSGTYKSLYAKTNSTKHDGAFTVYGGGNIDGKPVSRILKIEFWNDKDASNGFAFKCGHFEANKTQSGAFIPDMKKPLSVNRIKMNFQEIAVMSYRLDLALANFVFKTTDDPFKCLNGDNK